MRVELPQATADLLGHVTPEYKDIKDKIDRALLEQNADNLDRRILGDGFRPDSVKGCNNG